MNNHRANFLALAIAAGVSAQPATAANAWESPYQAGRPSPKLLKLLPADRCESAGQSKCKFSAKVDWNRDGILDVAEMMEGAGLSAIVVRFGGTKRPAMTVASFSNTWSGDCYIEPAKQRRSTFSLTCPEASSAVFKMRQGKPMVRWIAD